MDIKKWEEGKEHELGFWRDWLKYKSDRYQNLLPLGRGFDFMIRGKKEVTIANLGAGATCIIGNTRKDVKVNVVSSDLMADEYNKFCEELNIKFPTPVEKQDMTNLTYEDESFDIVYCSNALDHCQDPYKALLEMVRICKTGGWIYIRHIAHEGQRHLYRGLHKWNFDMTEDGDCIVWNNDTNPKTDTFLLSEIYPGFVIIFKPGVHASFVTSFVKKK